MRRIRYLLVAFLLIPLTSLSGQEITLDLAYTFPSEATEDTSFYLYAPSDMELLPSGHIAISDFGHHCIFIVTKTGELIHTIGRQGQGPGEFIGLNDLAVDHVNGLLWAKDNRGLQAFSLTSYEYIDYIRPPTVGRDFKALDGLLYLFTINPRDNEIVSVYGRDGSLIKTLGEHVERETQKQGIRLHKSGYGGVQLLKSGLVRVLYVYSNYNDIVKIEGDQQICFHLDDSRIERGHRERIVTTRQWDQDRSITPTQMFASVFLDEEVFYLATQHNMGDRIFQIDYSGNIECTWIQPVERSHPLFIIVINENEKKTFLVLDRWAGRRVVVYKGLVPAFD